MDLHRWPRQAAPALAKATRYPAHAKLGVCVTALVACCLRRFHPHRKGDYSVWNMKTLARARNHGSRVDFVLAGSPGAGEVGTFRPLRANKAVQEH